MKTDIAFKSIVVAALFAAVIFFQYGYDATAVATAAGTAPVQLSPGFVRTVDMGFNAPIASFAWIGTMPDIIDLFLNGKTEYFSGLDFVTGVDPKLSYPYAFSVITVPAVASYPNAVQTANAIGARGLAAADPDWRIPFYMATNYFLYLKDKEDALRYYDIAARTPGIPPVSQRFAINFSIGFGTRAQMENLWKTIRDTTNDPSMKQRAQAYIDRFDALDYLEAAAKQYKTEYGAFPKTPNDLVAKHIIPQIPQDPFGYAFIFNADGTATVDIAHPPAVIGQ